MAPDFAKLVEHFQFDGEFVEVDPYGFGHINDTYAARFRQGNGDMRRYIIQRINHNIFKRPDFVMHNMERVTRHMRDRIMADGGDPLRERITLVPTIDGKTYCQSSNGEYWRAHHFIEGARAYQKAESPEHYYHAARAFGRFLNMASDLPTNELHETIPDFHHTPKRFQAFIQATEKDPRNRARAVQAEIAFAQNRAAETTVLIDLVAGGKMPERVTHNDTKFDNVMLDNETGEGICVIDLDTVMAGLAVFDFGDSVRTGASTAAEDEPDSSKVRFDLEIFDRLAQGFLEETHEFLTPTEVDHLAFGAKLITFEQGIRFLTDYLNGDVYYKTRRPEHNLDRCRTQFKLVSEMEASEDQMIRVIEAYQR